MSDPSQYLYNTKEQHFLVLEGEGYGENWEHRVSATWFKNIDDKIDDGEYNSGSMRSDCIIGSGDNYDDYGVISYSEAIKNGNRCEKGFFRIDL